MTTPTPERKGQQSLPVLATASDLEQVHQALTMTSDLDLELQIEALREERRRRRPNAQILVSSSESESEEKVQDWSIQRMHEVKDLILEVHSKQRGHAHGPATAGEWNFDKLKYEVLCKHLATNYNISRQKGTFSSVPGGKLLPPTNEQRDNLLALVLHDCGPCSKLRREREADTRERAATEDRLRKDWKMRYEHRLSEQEYESDENHQADITCGTCKQRAGRKAFLNKRFADDRDDLFNCEGCTRAFHHFCGGLTQDSPEARRRHGLDPYRALTFARRVEPHLCEECWRNAARRQLDYERKKYEDDRAKAAAKREAKRARLSTISSGEPSVNADLYGAYSALSRSQSSPAGMSDDDEDDDGSFLQFSSFEDCLKALSDMQNFERDNRSKKAKSLYVPLAEGLVMTPSQPISGSPKIPTLDEKFKFSSENLFFPVSARDTSNGFRPKYSLVHDGKNCDNQVFRTVTPTGNFGVPLTIRSDGGNEFRNDTPPATQESKEAFARDRGERQMMGHINDYHRRSWDPMFLRARREGRLPIDESFEERFADRADQKDSVTKGAATAEENGTYTSDVFIAEIAKIVGCGRKEAEEKFFSTLSMTPTPLSAMAQAISILTQDKFRSPIDALREIYEGCVSKVEMQTPDVEIDQYAKVRKFVINLINDESSTNNEEQIQRLFNIALETTMNVQTACMEVAERLEIEVSVISAHVRNLTICSNESEMQLFWRACQGGFLKCRTECRRKIQEVLCEEIPGHQGSGIAVFSKELKLHGQFAKAFEETLRTLRNPHKEEDTPSSATSATEVVLPATTGTDDLPPTGSKLDETQQFSPIKHESSRTEPQNSMEFKDSSALWSGQLHGKPEHPKRTPLPEDASLKDSYQRALLDESQNAENQGISYSLQLDRPIQWETKSTDPKYPCAGFVQSAYLFWKNHCQKRRAQGAPQKYVTFISFGILQMMVATLKIKPATRIVAMSDEELINLLDQKFQIAQKTNLLMKKFVVPPRPKSLASYELHIPHEDFHLYATEWLSELNLNQERHKDLDKYNLSDVFIQSLQDCKMLHDHARVLSKLSVEDLIASCSDYLGEQVLNENKTAVARKQLQNPDTTSDSQNPKGAEARVKQENVSKAPFTMKQARAFLTEAAKGGNGGDKKVSFATLPKGTMAFMKLPSFDAHCEGCGKSYKSDSGKTFPYPCHGVCQYTGHPSMNTRYQEGSKWKHPGHCLTWKGLEDKEIPGNVLARLKRYSETRKRDRDSSM